MVKYSKIDMEERKLSVNLLIPSIGTNIKILMTSEVVRNLRSQDGMKTHNNKKYATFNIYYILINRIFDKLAGIRTIRSSLFDEYFRFFMILRKNT